MKMLLKAVFPTEPFNALVKKATAGKLLEKAMEELQPEEAHFTLSDGKRCLLMVVNVNNPADYVKYAEPFFLQFNAQIKYDITISPTDMKASGLEAIGKKYA